MSATLTAATAVIPHVELRGHDVEVVDATHDSREVQAGWLFCAVAGEHTDGHDHAAEAVERGAAGLLVERWLDLPVPQARVPSVRAAMGPVASAVHGYPSERLDVIGITGTNGKTTTAYLLEAVLGASARGTGVIGTVETRIHGEAQPGLRTTPEGTDLQRLLGTMLTRGVDAVAMEVSSHGLDLRRVDGTRYAVAVFTNLSQDHLDWHGTMENYFAAKARLFTTHLSERGIVCIDGEWGPRLLEQATVPCTSFGRSSDAEHRVVDIEAGLGGTAATLIGPHTRVRITTPLLGEHNVLNAAGAYLAARAIGVDSDAALEGLAACTGVPGRLDRVEGDGPTVLVDYAHTPDALDQVVTSLRGLMDGGRLTVVIGCGGDRDKGKRPQMGAVAARADRAILTSDNPRSEDPQAILDEMAKGAEEAVVSGAPAELVREVDRREAIQRAIATSGPDDVVLIAGKGHETGQEFADRTVPFDDRRVASEVLGATQEGVA